MKSAIILSMMLTGALNVYAVQPGARTTASKVEFGTMIDDSLAERKEAAKGLQDKINIKKINVNQKRQAFRINKINNSPDMVNVSDSSYQANYHQDKVEKQIAKNKAKRVSPNEINKQNSELEKDIANSEFGE